MCLYNQFVAVGDRITLPARTKHSIGRKSMCASDSPTAAVKSDPPFLASGSGVAAKVSLDLLLFEVSPIPAGYRTLHNKCRDGRIVIRALYSDAMIITFRERKNIYIDLYCGYIYSCPVLYNLSPGLPLQE